MSINQVQIPYPDFKLHEIIDPEQFDLNNAELQNKINAVITVLNQITDSIADGSSGADKISLTAISPFISTKLQSFLEEVISRLQSTQDGSSGADFIASTSIPGVTGTTVQAQLESLKSIHSIQTQVNSNSSSITNLQTQITNHKNAPVLDHPDGSVTAVKLADNSVTTSKIANGAVTADKIHSSLLNTVSLSAHRNSTILDHPDFSVTTEKLAPESVTFDKLGLDVIGYIGNEVGKHSADNVKHITAAERAAWNNAESNAKAYANSTFARKQQEAWISPTLLNGWKNFDSGAMETSFFKDEFGIVHVVGNLKGGITTSGTVIFVLPQGYRPIKRFTPHGICIDTNGIVVPCTIDVNETGEVVVGTNVKNLFLPLSFSFRAEK